MIDAEIVDGEMQYIGEMEWIFNKLLHKISNTSLQWLDQMRNGFDLFDSIVNPFNDCKVKNVLHF